MSDREGTPGVEERLRDVLAARVDGFVELASCERLSGGASQETYRIAVETTAGERLLCMRRSPGGGRGGGGSFSGQVNPGLATEALLMRCARDAGIPEPGIVHILEPEDGLGPGFLMEWLEGETLGPRIVRSPDLAEVRPRLASQIGRVLARIHAIDLDTTGLRDRLVEMTAGEFVEQTWQRYKSLDTPQPMIDYAGRWLVENLPEGGRKTLVHNDFRNGNLIVGPDGVVAVLDWEIAHIGDPMRDLGWICTNSWRFGGDGPVGGFGDYEDLIQAYEEESGHRIERDHVKFWEVFGSFWWACGTLGMSQHFRTGPDRSVERAAIGRRTSECQVDCVNLLIPGPVELIEPRSDTSSLDMPRIDELLVGVRDFLRGDVMDSTRGRINFLSRVSGNALDIVLRQLELGPEHRRLEQERLDGLLGQRGTLEDQRWKLVDEIRSGRIALDDGTLIEYLRTTVVNQIAIDQPRYSGFRQALEAT